MPDTSKKKMPDTSNRIEDEYTPAEAIDTSTTATTHSISPSVPSIPTNRYDGKVKLRLAPREIPDRAIDSTTV